MAFTTTRTATTRPGLFSQPLARLAAAFTAWHEARATRIALSRLSDRELDDIGLSRHEIDRVARNL